MPIEWTSCVEDLSRWISLRKLLLFALLTPWIYSLLLSISVVILFTLLRIKLGWRKYSLIIMCSFLIAHIQYSSIATNILTNWLSSKLPSTTKDFDTDLKPIAVLVGRGPQIADVTTRDAAQSIKENRSIAVYVSGDRLSTANQLIAKGVPKTHVAGDSCAQTTWENAVNTKEWIRKNYPGSPVLLITDPWQLPRASRSFARQGLKVIPQSSYPKLSERTKNAMAIRETLAIILYELMDRQ